MRKDDIALLVMLVVFISAFAVVPVMWFYSTVDTCGWKGLFVQCRITDCPK